MTRKHRRRRNSAAGWTFGITGTLIAGYVGWTLYRTYKSGNSKDFFDYLLSPTKMPGGASGGVGGSSAPSGPSTPSAPASGTQTKALTKQLAVEYGADGKYKLIYTN